MRWRALTALLASGAFALALFVVSCAGLQAAPGDREAHTWLTDGVRSGAAPESQAFVSLLGDACQLPRTRYDLGDFCFWGSGYDGFDFHDDLLKEAGVLGVGMEIGWFALQGKGPETDYAIWDVEDRVNYYARNGYTISAQLGYTPGWANGVQRKSFPPNIPVEAQVVDLTNGPVQLGHAPVIMTLPLWYPMFVTPWPLPTTRHEEEVITTNFVPDPQFDENSPRTSASPVLVGSETVWVDEGGGWEQWSRVDNFFNAPDGEKVYQMNRVGVVRFKPENVWHHARTPAPGSKVKISYSSINRQYLPGADYLFDHLTGTLTRRLGDISGFVPSETFESKTLAPAWSWVNPPAEWDSSVTSPGSLHHTINTNPADQIGHFLYETLDGAGDFRLTMKINKCAVWRLGVQRPLTQTGVMVYQDENNWFRYALTTDQGRPYLTQCIGGVITTRGADGKLGWMVTPPRWINVQKVGDTYTVYTSFKSGATSPDGGYQASVTFDQALAYPLRVGPCSIGQDSEGADIDQFDIQTPQIPAGQQVAVFYNYLNPDPWLSYVREVVGHYRDRIKFWQSWNEPDQWWCWAGGQDLHAVMQGLFANAVREADPEARVIGGGYANGSNHHIETVYKLAGPGAFDYASWHPYLFSASSPDSVGWASGANDRARAIMASYGDSEKEVFFGEIASDSGVLQSGGGTNDRIQADYGTRLLLHARRLGWVKSVQWWPGEGDLADVGEHEDDQYGSHAGLFYFVPGRQRDIAGISRTGGKVAIQVTNHTDLTYRVGDRFVVSEVLPPNASFNAEFTVEELQSVYNPLFGTSKVTKIICTQNGLPDASTSAPSGLKVGIIRPVVEPKPVFYALRNLACNKGILMDLGSYDSESKLTPAGGSFPVTSVRLGLRDVSELAEVSVFTSLTCTDDRSRPSKVAAAYRGVAGQKAVVVNLNPASPALRTEKWTITALTPYYFGVEGSESGYQGIAIAGIPFASLNGVVAAVTIPMGDIPYATGEQFVFETFAGDGFKMAAVWKSTPGLSGPGQVRIDFPSPVNARYVQLQFRKAAGAASIGIDEVEVFDTSGANVAESKLYSVEGHQSWFASPAATQYSVGAARTLPDSANVEIPSAVLYLKGGGFGYVQSPDRAAGIRIEGAFEAVPGDLVTLKGWLDTKAGGERVVRLVSLGTVGQADAIPLGINGANLQDPMADGLLVRCWGMVKPGSVDADSFVLDTHDGEIQVQTPGAPTVVPGDTVSVVGAAGFDGRRIIHHL